MIGVEIAKNQAFVGRSSSNHCVGFDEELMEKAVDEAVEYEY